MFLCSRGRGGHGCQHDTLDHCPKHAGQVESRPKKILTAEEAESIRLDIWKKNLRSNCFFDLVELLDEFLGI